MSLSGIIYLITYSVTQPSHEVNFLKVNQVYQGIDVNQLPLPLSDLSHIIISSITHSVTQPGYQIRFLQVTQGSQAIQLSVFQSRLLHSNSYSENTSVKPSSQFLSELISEEIELLLDLASERLNQAIQLLESASTLDLTCKPSLLSPSITK